LSPHISQLQKSGSPRQNSAETVLAGFDGMYLGLFALATDLVCSAGNALSNA